jgi:hypothetical protein
VRQDHEMPLSRDCDMIPLDAVALFVRRIR